MFVALFGLFGLFCSPFNTRPQDLLMFEQTKPKTNDHVKLLVTIPKTLFAIYRTVMRESKICADSFIVLAF